MRSMQLLRHPEFLASIARTHYPIALEETITFYTNSVLRTVARGGGKVLVGHGTEDRVFETLLPPALLYLNDTLVFPPLPTSDPSPDLTMMPPDLIYLSDTFGMPTLPTTDPSPDTSLLPLDQPTISDTIVFPDLPDDTVTMTIT